MVNRCFAPSAAVWLVLALPCTGFAQPKAAETPAGGDWLAARAARLPRPASLVDISDLAGRWRVAGVAVLPGPVSAFAANDPAYMGRVLDVSPERLAWADAARGAASGATLDDRCGNPATARRSARIDRQAAAGRRAALASLGVTRALSVENEHEILCLGDGTWGPEAAGGAVLFPVSRDAFAMTWYDGVVLRLERVRATGGGERRPTPQR